MAKFTPSMAKNQMRRAMLAICDPLPSKPEVIQLWKHFNSCCAYCGKDIAHKSRTGHLDHVRSASDGGDNSIFNFVLSCAICNGDKKREAKWTDFLKSETNGNLEAYNARLQKINEWIQKKPIKVNASNANDKKILIDAIIKDALENFDKAIEKLRALKP